MPRRRRAGPPARDPFDPLDGAITDTLDLHGFRAAEAKQQVVAFITRAQRRSPGGLLHIITGRGRHSVAGPVLRTAVRTLLRSECADQIEAWGRDLDDGGYLVRLKGAPRH